MLTLTVAALASIAVPFLAYPLLLWARAYWAPAPLLMTSTDLTPDVDLVICAYNEADAITDKLTNALSLDYPAGRLSIIVASDGSTDATVALARQFEGRGVRVLDLPRAGKAAALNTAVAAGHASVVAFSDANSEWDRGALRALVAPLADPQVGGVAGDQRYKNRNVITEYDASSGERGYWRFDRMLKRWQSRAGNAISATGAIYCVRRTLFEPAPPDATDDFMISTAVIAAGKRLVFASGAVALEPPASDARLEFRRKTRVISRGLRSVYYRRTLLNPMRSGFYALELLVHKLWRRLVWLPALILLCIAPFSLSSGGPAAWVGAMVLAVAALAAAGLSLPALVRFRLFAVPAYVVLVNAACVVATVNLLRGHRVAQWHLPRETHATDLTAGDQ